MKKEDFFYIDKQYLQMFFVFAFFVYLTLAIYTSYVSLTLTDKKSVQYEQATRYTIINISFAFISLIILSFLCLSGVLAFMVSFLILLCMYVSFLFHSEILEQK